MNSPKIEKSNQPMLLFGKMKELIMKGKFKEFKKLLKGRNELVYCANEYSQTALHLSVIEGHLEFVKYLLKKKSDINAQDRQGWTPLFSACFSSNLLSNLPIFSLLLNHNAQLNIETCSSFSSINNIK